MRSHFKARSNRKHISQAPIKRGRWPWLAQGTGCQMWHLGCSFHDSQRMKELLHLRLEWETAQDSLLRAQGHTCSAACESLPSHAPALM